MDVSIVIVNYNTCRLLDECIESIKRETRCEYEIIVVDNASSDDSCKMIKTKHPDVLLIENAENSGFAKANNLGFARARGRYFFMLNPDTVILDRAIDKLVDFMDNNHDAGICGPRNVGPDGALQHNCDHFPSVWNTLCYYASLGELFPKSRIFNRCWMRYWDYDGVRNVERMTGCSLMIRSSLFREVGGLDESYFMYFEETDFCYQAHLKGKKTVYFPYSCIIHYGGESAKTVKSIPVYNNVCWTYFYKSQYYFFRKNYGLLPTIAIKLLDALNGLKICLLSFKHSNADKKNNNMKIGLFLIKTALNVK